MGIVNAVNGTVLQAADPGKHGGDMLAIEGEVLTAHAHRDTGNDRLLAIQRGKSFTGLLCAGSIIIHAAGNGAEGHLRLHAVQCSTIFGDGADFLHHTLPGLAAEPADSAAQFSTVGDHILGRTALDIADSNRQRLIAPYAKTSFSRI